MLLASLLFAASLAQPQAPDTLATASVVGYRSPESLSGAPLQRVSDSFISKTGSITLVEALRTLSGISVKDYGGIGGLKTVDIRSFGARHTGISYDGITVSDLQNGQVDIGRFNLEDVSGIELDISGSEDIFRSARLASYVGTLSITTSKPRFDGGNSKLTARMRAGSFLTLNPYLKYEQKIGKRWAGAVNADFISSRGDYPFIIYNGVATKREFRLNSDVRSINSEARVFGDFGKGGDLLIKAALYASERGLPGSVVLYNQNPTERLWDRNIWASAVYKLSLGRAWKLKTSLGYSSAFNRYVNTDRIYAEPLNDKYLQQEAYISATALWSPSDKLQLSIAEDFVVGHLDANIKNSLFPTRESSYTALSAKYQSERFTLTGTLLGTIVREQTLLGEPAPSRNRLSPSVILSYKPLENQNFRLRASFKESFRLPSFNDIYYPRVGNKNLKPEEAYQTNLGITWYGDWGGFFMRMSADGYQNLVKNKIVAVPTMFIWSMRNVGRVSMTGCDLTASADRQMGGGFRLKMNAGYSYQYVVDITDPEAKNYKNQIAYTPRHSGNAAIILETPWLNIGYTVNAVGERFSLAQNTPAYRIDPYADHCISLNRTFAFGKEHSRQIHLSAEALNLSGVNYEVIKYYPMPGRNYRLTIKITY